MIAQLGDDEDILGVADLLQDVSVEPLGEKQNAFLFAGGTKEPAFSRMGKNRPAAAAAAPVEGAVEGAASRVPYL